MRSIEKNPESRETGDGKRETNEFSSQKLSVGKTDN
jgi:hypothetical protein